MKHSVRRQIEKNHAAAGTPQKEDEWESTKRNLKLTQETAQRIERSAVTARREILQRLDGILAELKLLTAPRSWEFSIQQHGLDGHITGVTAHCRTGQ